MTWARLDDNFPWHPKVAGLTDREFRVHVETICYCARYHTDGEIPRSAWKNLRINRAVSRRLVEARVWEETDGKFSVHDFQIYNGDTLEDRIEAYLAENPSATANEIHRAIGGNRKVVLAIVRTLRDEVPDRFPNGSPPVPEAVPDQYHPEPFGGSEGGFARAVPAPKDLKQQQQDPSERATPAAAGPAAAAHAAAADIDQTNPQTLPNLAHALDDLGLDTTTRLAAHANPERALAWIHLAQTEAHTNPAGYARTGILTGQWPTPRTNGPAPAPKLTPLERGIHLAATAATVDDPDWHIWLTAELADLDLTPDERDELLEAAAKQHAAQDNTTPPPSTPAKAPRKPADAQKPPGA